MIKNYLLITLRSMMKSKVYLFINIFGMAISIACCIVAYYTWKFNADFDTVHEKASSIYRINSVRRFQDADSEYGIVPLPLPEIARENIKDFSALTRYSVMYADVRIDDEIFENRISYVDKDFFKMFTFEFIEGNGDVLADKSKVIISEENAIRMFGTVNAVGKTMSHILRGAPKFEYEVGAVFKTPPMNSSFNDEAFLRYENLYDLQPDLNDGTNWKFRTTAFVQLNEATRISEIEKQLQPYTENNNKVREDFVMKAFHLDPLVGMAKRDEYGDRQGRWTRSASPLAAVVGVSVMAILVLLIACFNLTNTAIAMSSRRLKEIGLRKVMGSARAQLIMQFIGETMFVCFLALILGIIIGEYFLIPAFNALWPEMKLNPHYFQNLDFLGMMTAVLLATSLLAGSYPAFYISRFQPTEILKGKTKFGGSNVFAKSLLGLQFVISLTAIVCSLAFIDNAKYQRDFDLGFSQSTGLYSWVESEDEFNALKTMMEKNPDVLSIAGSQHHILASGYNDPIKSEGKEIEVDILHVSAEYIPTMGMTIVEGRNFNQNSETDARESVIVSEKVVRKFGWDKAIGKEIVWMDTVKLYVVGVVKDVYNRGLWREMEPNMFRYSPPKDYKHLVLSATAQNLPKVNQYMEAHWKEVFPNRKFSSHYNDDEMVEANSVNINIVKMFVFLGAVAMMLSVTGLFTLVSLNIIRRMKEIGVRKVLGASVANISRVINFEFLIILLLAALGGGFAGAYLAELLMSQIWNFYQETTIITMILSSAIMLLLSAFTVAMKTWNTAKMNPVKVLRDE